MLKAYGNISGRLMLCCLLKFHKVVCVLKAYIILCMSNGGSLKYFWFLEACAVQSVFGVMFFYMKYHLTLDFHYPNMCNQNFITFSTQILYNKIIFFVFQVIPFIYFHFYCVETKKILRLYQVIYQRGFYKVSKEDLWRKREILH